MVLDRTRLLVVRVALVEVQDSLEELLEAQVVHQYLVRDMLVVLVRLLFTTAVEVAAVQVLLVLMEAVMVLEE
jgi:hypothetical protein